MTGGADAVHHWSAEIRAALGQQVDPVGDRLLLVRRQTVPPVHELIGDLDFPDQPSMNDTS